MGGRPGCGQPLGMITPKKRLRFFVRTREGDREVELGDTTVKWLHDSGEVTVRHWNVKYLDNGKDAVAHSKDIRWTRSTAEAPDDLRELGIAFPPKFD